ncbi:MAG TPA: arginine--tRNA ligase [Planctomycetota bacterium]|nr:arginine--tRNA ligase [Planctomycetota bacterium]
MQRFSDEIRAALARHTTLALDEIRLERPRDPSLGDLAFPCFPLARALKQAPPAIAGDLAARLTPELADVEVTATGPYLNFRIARAPLAAEVFARITEAGDAWGGSRRGAGRTVVIDYSSPNIAKPMHVGHLRSTILGAALMRLFEAQGYRTVGINHIGDWGSQFGGLVVAIRRWRGEVDLEQDPVRGLLELYQRSKAAAADDPAFADEARAAWRELERGDEGEVRELWRWVTQVSLAAFARTYARLGIRHDLVRGESHYEPMLDATVARIAAAGVTEESDGALIVALGDVDKGLKETPCLLRQGDGTTLYATRDLAAAFSRWEEFAFERCLYVVGAEQKLHFRQLKAVLQRLELEWEPRVEHVDFGLLLGPGRVKLASRKGTVLILDELLDEVVGEARAVIEAKNPALADKDAVAEAVGIGALVFNDLKRERIKDVLFDRAEILSFEGDTGPYVQFTHARLASILRKAEASGDAGLAAEPDLAQLESAGAILVALGRLPDVVSSAADRAEPSELAQYLLALAREVSGWLSAPENKVLAAEPALGAARLALVRAAKCTLANGLRLLGVNAPEEM